MLVEKISHLLEMLHTTQVQSDMYLQDGQGLAWQFKFAWRESRGWGKAEGRRALEAYVHVFSNTDSSCSQKSSYKLGIHRVCGFFFLCFPLWIAADLAGLATLQLHAPGADQAPVVKSGLGWLVALAAGNSL